MVRFRLPQKFFTRVFNGPVITCVLTTIKRFLLQDAMLYRLRYFANFDVDYAKNDQLRFIAKLMGLGADVLDPEKVRPSADPISPLDPERPSEDFEPFDPTDYYGRYKPGDPEYRPNYIGNIFDIAYNSDYLISDVTKTMSDDYKSTVKGTDGLLSDDYGRI